MGVANHIYPYICPDTTISNEKATSADPDYAAQQKGKQERNGLQQILRFLTSKEKQNVQFTAFKAQ